jgi:hypothetical protein
VITTLVKGRGMEKSGDKRPRPRSSLIHLKENKMDKVVGGGEEFYYMYIRWSQRDVVYLLADQ